MSDEVIRELWCVKDAMAQGHGHDVRGFAAYLQGKKRWECPRQPSGRSTFEVIRTDRDNISSTPPRKWTTKSKKSELRGTGDAGLH